ncbi:MAG: rhomboid family intramembrane serine protease [Deltaproteobacteria bacterium]|nr:MAG: rhomboid family intramembrane serine protease [Deltaproteobacteria bacterium]
MASKTSSGALLCPQCRKLVSRSVESCPYCGLKRPGSPLKDNIFIKGPGGTKLLQGLIVVNVAMFVLAFLLDFRPDQLSFSPFSFLSPSSRSLLVLGATGEFPLLQLHRWWSLIAASFLHGGLLHIVFNMMVLYQLAPLVLHEFGVSRSFLIYTLSGIAGFLLSSFAGVGVTIGASAAVCGFIGALLFYGWHRGGTYGQAIFRQIGGWAISIGVFGLLVPGINNWGHGGGMLAGFLVAMALGYKEQRQESFVHRILALGALAVTAAVLVWSCFNGVLFFFSATG